VAIGYFAMPSVSFDAVTIQTASAQLTGGDLARSGDKVHLILCTPLADATSTDARLQNVSTKDVVKISASGHAAFDSGERRPFPRSHSTSSASIGLPQSSCRTCTLARRRATGAPPRWLSAGSEDPALGAGVIAGPAPPSGRAVDGEKPIDQTTEPRIARLARRYQPTLEVSVADRFWPASVGALLADVAPAGTCPCLVTPAVSPACRSVTSVPATSQPADYLRLPTTANANADALTENPAAQFRAFEAGQHPITGSLHHRLADPAILDPWRTAQLYFCYGGPVHFAGVAGRLPAWPTVKAVFTPGTSEQLGRSDRPAVAPATPRSSTSGTPAGPAGRVTSARPSLGASEYDARHGSLTPLLTTMFGGRPRGQPNRPSDADPVVVVPKPMKLT
jgi:hypothetical protein